MGKARARKLEFLKNNPMCCFCGGETPSEEEDHVPGRALFLNRAWPEGFTFPACQRCNRATRLDELAAAMLVRTWPDAKTPEEVRELERAISGAGNNIPGLLEEMRLGSVRRRQAAREFGVEADRNSGTLNLPILQIGPIGRRSLQRFGYKLACALYYRHTNKIAPSFAGVYVHHFTNLQVAKQQVPQGIAELLTAHPTLKRARTNLDNQFFYSYTLAIDAPVAIFIAEFREAIKLLLYIDGRLDWRKTVPDVVGDDFRTPCNWTLEGARRGNE